MNLKTNYLGLTLEHPLMPGASPLADDMDTVRRLEDAGAPAIALYSLFEEQLRPADTGDHPLVEINEAAFAESLSHFPALTRFAAAPDEYLEKIRRIKAATALPVIASLNGSTPGSWLHFARLIEQAGANALELNIYFLATDPWDSAAETESATVNMVREVKSGLTIPVAVKLSPFYTALAHFARELEDAGADALVIFNEFHQPDIQIESRDLIQRWSHTGSEQLSLRLRWLAILSGTLQLPLVATGGVRDASDAIKAIMAGATTVQMVSALLEHGPDHLRTVRRGVEHWLDTHGYDSLEPIRGCMNLHHGPNPRVYERANYLEMLHALRQKASGS